MKGKNIYFWSAINRFGSQTLGFIGNILIARQLSPEDYGLVAMVAIIMGIAWNFTESGFADCLIRKTNVDKKDFGTVLSFNVVIALFMYMAIYFSAPYIAIFFNKPELTGISRILGVSIIIRSFSVTELTRLRKELKFKKTTIIQITSSMVSISIAYSLAIYGFGYWALVFQSIVLGLSTFILIILLEKWVPYFYFSWSRFREMSGFSFNLLISYLTNQVGQNLYAFFIGKYHSALTLGFYRQAQKIKDAPVMGLNSVILTTTYPVLANEKNIKKRYSLYISLLNNFLFVQFLLCAFLIGGAYPIIEILFGEKWVPAVPYFQLMIIAYLFYPLTTFNLNIAKVHGKAKLYRNLTFLRNGLLVIALLVTMNHSIKVILYGQIIALWLSVFIDMVACGNLIDFGVLKQLKVVAKQIWIPWVTLTFAYLLSKTNNSSLIEIVLFSGIFVLSFFILNEAARSHTYIHFKTKMVQKLAKLIQYEKVFKKQV